MKRLVCFSSALLLAVLLLGLSGVSAPAQIGGWFGDFDNLGALIADEIEACVDELQAWLDLDDGDFDPNSVNLEDLYYILHEAINVLTSQGEENEVSCSNLLGLFEQALEQIADLIGNSNDIGMVGYTNTGGVAEPAGVPRGQVGIDVPHDELWQLTVAKIEAELYAVYGWLAWAYGSLAGMNEAIEELLNFLDELEGVDLTNLTEAQFQALVEEAIDRFLGLVVLIQGGLFFNDQLGPLDAEFFDLWALGFYYGILAQLNCLYEGGLGWAPVVSGTANAAPLQAINAQQLLNTCVDPDTGDPLLPFSVDDVSVSSLAAQELSVEKTYASPNPASLSKDSQVRFVAEGKGISEVQVEIYDLAGGKIYSSGLQSGNALSWNLLNSNGQSVANGVYLYVITAKSTHGQVVRNEVQKLVVLK